MWKYFPNESGMTTTECGNAKRKEEWKKERKINSEVKRQPSKQKDRQPACSQTDKQTDRYYDWQVRQINIWNNRVL
jgi:hypothetical protein